MKITSLLITLAIISASAATKAQNITLSEKNISLQRVLEKIRIQSGYDFVGNSKLIRSGNPVTIDLKNVGLEEALRSVFSNQELTFEIDNKTVLIKEKRPFFPDVIMEKMQDINVKGTVLDEKGNPLAGASIIIKGTSLATTTDKNGVFVLNGVNEKAIIIISFLGYKTLELPAGKANGRIALKAATTNLDEVNVTTAYGIVRSKKELGYSVAKVSGEEINRANSGNILSGLTGKVSGLNIMAQSSEMTPQMRVLLRGIRSFGESSNNQPLFVFNGSPLSFGSDGDAAARAIDFLNTLNPADVEEVTVLKGANGTAMYGPEGVNGVIIITTKRTKPGELLMNARVNNSWNRMDFRQRVDQRTFGVGNETGILVNRSNSNWGPAYDGRIINIGYPDQNGRYQQVPYSDLNDRYNFFDVARTTRTNVSMTQGDYNSSFYLGLGYLDQTGLLPGDKQNQATALFTSSKRVGKFTEIQTNINYSRTVNDRGGDVTGKVLNTPSFIPLLSYKDYENSHWGNKDNYWSGVNPYAGLALARTKQIDNSLSASITANVRIRPWLYLKDQVSVNYLGRTKKENGAAIYFSDYARLDPLKSNDVEPKTKDYLASSFGLNNDLMLSAVHRTGNWLFRGNLGTSVRDNYDKALQTQATLVLPVYNLIFARSDFGIGGDENTTQSRSISALGNLSIGYKNKAFLELTGRNEWDSKRAKVARGKDLYFGANTSLMMRDIIPSLKEWKWLSNFRMRASVTQTANMNIQPQQSEMRLSLVFPYPFTNPATGKSILGYSIFTNPNPLIKPEFVFSQEYGTEIGFMNNRIRLDAAYYRQINNGVIMRVGVPSWSSYPDLDNAGRFRNTGWEFDLNLDPLIDFGNNFYINVTGRFSINNNKVLKVSDIFEGTFIARDQNGNPFYAREGHSAFEFPVTDFIRDPEGHVIVDKKSGMPTVDYQNPKIMGRTLPVYQGGVSVSFVYKRFTLSSQADYSAGNDHQFDPSTISNGTSALTLMNNREQFVFPNSVIEESPGHYVPNTNVAVSNAGRDLFSRFAAATIHSISSASYWKIREVALQYEMPLKTKWAKRVAGSIYARDLFSFYPHSNVYGDPVASQGPGIKQAGVQAIGQRAASQTNNVSGGASDGNVAPGTVLYGFTLGISF